MTITRLKEKNQVTLPKSIVDRLRLTKNELFQVNIEKNYIILLPIEMKPKYSEKDLEKIDKVVEKGKKKAKIVKAGSGFAKYIDSMK